MTPIEQLKQLITAYADNLAAQERVLRQLYRVVERLTEPLPSTSHTSADAPMRICHSGEEHFIPLTKKDSTDSWASSATTAGGCCQTHPPVL